MQHLVKMAFLVAGSSLFFQLPGCSDKEKTIQSFSAVAVRPQTHSTPSGENGLPLSPSPTAAPTQAPEKPTPVDNVDLGSSKVPTVSATAIPVASKFSLGTPLQSSLNGREVWAVTTNTPNNIITRIEIDDAKTYPKQTWVMPAAEGTSGNRTFVSEIGLLIGRTGSNGGIWRAGPQVATLSGVEQIISAAELGQGAENRMCVTSFRIGSQAYIGGAYQNGTVLKFIRIPIDKTKPKMVDLDKKEIFIMSNDAKSTINNNYYGGYSCFIDQSRGFFWVQPIWTPVKGINVRTGEALDPAQKAPNKDLKLKIGFPAINNYYALWNYGSYVVSGDGAGNILNVDGFYASAYDPLSNSVFSSGAIGVSPYAAVTAGKIFITKNECFLGNSPDCPKYDANAPSPGAKHFEFEVASKMGGNPGPMSSLNDGNIAVATRSNSSLFLLSLVDKADFSKGVNIIKIADLIGDAYMYTDFTGSTLYATKNERTLDLSTSKDFISKKEVKKMTMKWNSLSGAAEQWTGLNLSVRCYAKGTMKKEAMKPIAPVPASGTIFELPDCKGLIDQVDILVEDDGKGNVFSRTKSIEVFGEQ